MPSWHRQAHHVASVNTAVFYQDICLQSFDAVAWVAGMVSGL